MGTQHSATAGTKPLEPRGPNWGHSPETALPWLPSGEPGTVVPGYAAWMPPAVVHGPRTCRLPSVACPSNCEFVVLKPPRQGFRAWTAGARNLKGKVAQSLHGRGPLVCLLFIPVLQSSDVSNAQDRSRAGQPELHLVACVWKAGTAVLTAGEGFLRVGGSAGC